MTPTCLQLVLITNNALVPPSVDHLLHQRIGERLAKAHGIQIPDPESTASCDLRIDYYYSTEKMIFVGDNFILQGKRELRIDDIMEGRIPEEVFAFHPTTESSATIPKHNSLAETKKASSRRLTKWVLGGVGILLGGLVIHNLAQKESKGSAPVPHSEPQKPSEGPKPIFDWR